MQFVFHSARINYDLPEVGPCDVKALYRIYQARNPGTTRVVRDSAWVLFAVSASALSAGLINNS